MESFPGLVKINFDEGKLGEWGRGWEAINRDSNGNILFLTVKQSIGFFGP